MFIGQDMSRMRRSFKYRIYTNTEQDRLLGEMVETHRRLYNQCLEQRKTAYDSYELGIGYCDQSAWFKNERKYNAWYAGLNFSSAQATMRRLNKAFVAFFRRCKSGEKPGYPRFKARERFDSVEFPAYGDGIKLTPDGKLRVHGVGKVRIKLHRPTQGEIKTVSIKREAGKWYAVFSCDLGDAPPVTEHGTPVGIDVGIESFLMTSDGARVESPSFLKHELKSLAREQRSLSRKKKGGRNRRKQARRVASLHCRIANRRRDFNHKIALDLVRRHWLVAVENLNVLGMLKNHRLARAIQDAGWASFLGILKGAAESAGSLYVEVPARNTSQECSGCGEIVRKTLADRWHECSCGASLHRDHNSAKVIVKRALHALPALPNLPAFVSLFLARTGPAVVNGGVVMPPLAEKLSP